ncbi:MAG: FGGY family carbohydrate kinase, partial [Elusimicrobia bacterium]|nr:FGGY family carbohydrate kinase [Elusimicrobiota bacterium]
MKTRDLLLALDQGSSSSRAVLFDLKGRIVALAQRPVRTKRPKAGWAEHDPLELAKTLEASLDAVLSKLGPKDRVLAAGLAVQRSTIVFCEKGSFKPAAPAPSWMDGRAAEFTAPLQERQGEVHGLSGLYATPYYSAPKIRWFLDREPKVRALADAGRLLCAPVSTFLAARLTKGAVVAADPTCAQRTLLMNLDTAAWDPGLLALFGLSAELLPSIRSSAGDWGVIERKGRKIPLLATVGDQQSAAIGLGAANEGDAVANYGTGAFLLRHTGPRPERAPGLLASAAATVGGLRGYYLEGTVHAAGTSFEWLKDNLGLMKDAKAIDEAFRKSKRRVLMLPAIGGLGAPRWDYKTKTAFFGLDSQTTNHDLVRATAEGLCMLLADAAAVMAASGSPVTRARVAGGLSRADAMMAFQADAIGATLERRKEVEATALGAAILAAKAAGLPDPERMADARIEKTFAPRSDEGARAKRRAEWTAFVESIQRLSREVGL